jgi:GT2 family glycosyltransferase
MAEDLLATVVVAVKGDHRVYRLLDSLLGQTLASDTFEILVVENGSSQFADLGGVAGGVVQYLHVAEPNMAAARNRGLNAARGRYLLLTDADCVARPDWIERMTICLGAGRYAAVGGGIDRFEPKTWTQRYAITVVDGQVELSYLPALTLPYVAGANAGFVTAALRDIGGFDERFKSGSDVDICYRLGLRGYQVGLAPDAPVWHEDRASVLAHFLRFKRYAVYQVLLFATYRHLTRRRIVINTYPLKRVARAFATTPQAAVGLLCGDFGPWSRALLQLVEAAGVWCGDIEGSIRYRQLYL